MKNPKNVDKNDQFFLSFFPDEAEDPDGGKELFPGRTRKPVTIPYPKSVSILSSSMDLQFTVAAVDQCLASQFCPFH